MTTELRQPLTRKVGGLVITLTPEGVYTREVGSRTTFGPLPLAWIHQRAALAAAESRKPRRKVSRGLLSTRDPLEN